MALERLGGETMTILAQNMKHLRAGVGMTQEMLARTADLPLGTITRIEGGKVNPRVDTAEKIASALGVTISDLLDPNLNKKQLHNSQP